MFLPTLQQTGCCLTSDQLAVRLEIFLCLKKEQRLLVAKAVILTESKNSGLLSGSELLLLGLLLDISPDYA